MVDQLRVEPRTKVGKLHNRRLRDSGRMPAVLYGHGEESVSLALATDQLEAAVRHGTKVVDLAGAARGKALLHDVQWDTFFHQILHVDLLRVVAGEKVTVEVPIELKGEAPGAVEGGIIEQSLHAIEIEVPLDQVPEKLHININHLAIGGELTIKDIADLPPGATVFAEMDDVVVHCEESLAEQEAVDEAESAEPEVITRAKEDEPAEGAEGEDKQ